MRDTHFPRKLQAPLASTITSVLGTMFKAFSEQWGITCVYDPGLSTKTTLEGKMTTTTSSLKDIWRKDKEFKEVDPAPTYPIFSWNRKPIGLAEAYANRGSYGQLVQQNMDDGNVLDLYAGSVSSVTVDWRYITQNIAEMEQFEIMYLGGQSIAAICYLDMLFFDQGPFKFEVMWDPQLNTLQTNDDDFAYISVGGQVVITGPMIVILGKQIPRLERIVFRLYVTGEKSPICEVPLPRLVSHSVLEMEMVVDVNNQGEL